MKSPVAILILFLPLLSAAADRWTSVGSVAPPIEALLVNLGSVVMNGNGNLVATVRSKTGSYQMDIVTEYDCVNRRTRSIASVLTDGTGRLVSASGEGKFWFNEKQSVGLDTVCTAALTAQ